MKQHKNKILVTGGASGIGRHLTERFWKDDNTVIICGRREDALQEAAGQMPGLITRQCDVGKSADREALFAWIGAEHPDLNVLVNNAGIQNWMSISDDDFFSRAQQEIAVNIEGPLHLTSLFLRLPSAEAILNVTSGLAYIPFTKVPIYSATKAFFHSFTVSLRHQLKSRNIEVIDILPPALKTDLGGKGLHDFAPAVDEFADAVFAQLREGKQEITFGFSEALRKSNPDELQLAFDKMNP